MSEFDAELMGENKALELAEHARPLLDYATSKASDGFSKLEEGEIIHPGQDEDNSYEEKSDVVLESHDMLEAQLKSGNIEEEIIAHVLEHQDSQEFETHKSIEEAQENTSEPGIPQEHQDSEKPVALNESVIEEVDQMEKSSSNELGEGGQPTSTSKETTKQITPVKVNVEVPEEEVEDQVEENKTE